MTPNRTFNREQFIDRIAAHCPEVSRQEIEAQIADYDGPMTEAMAQEYVRYLTQPADATQPDPTRQFSRENIVLGQRLGMGSALDSGRSRRQPG